MLKPILTAAAFVAFGTAASANNGIGETVSGTFKGGPNSAHGQSYGSVNKAVNEAIRENGSYTSVHSGKTYDKPGAGNRLGNGAGNRN